MKPQSLIVAGVMSGTSADGVDVALCRIAPARKTSKHKPARNSSIAPSDHNPPRIHFLGHAGFPYPRAIRAELLRIMEGAPTSGADLSRLNWRLGALYADCIEKTAAKFKLKPALVGLHGQTIHHETTAHKYLGAPVRSTWQIGEAAVIAERLRCPVVSDFRPADLAAGGQGAPLVPMLDFTLFRHPSRNRILLNLGGIANVTAIPAAASIDSLLAFDTGPGNMVIDALMQHIYGKPYDSRGRVAGSGRSLGPVIDILLRDKYFKKKPPKSFGREQFGAHYAQRLRNLCHDFKPSWSPAGGTDADAIATAMQLTVCTIILAYQKFCQPLFASGPVEVIAAGGGARNDLLMRFLTINFRAVGAEFRTADSLGIPSQAKEAVAFALLAWLTHFGLPGNAPAATGASRPAILGKVSHA